MKIPSLIFALALFLGAASLSQAQSTVYRYGSVYNARGNTFYAMDGSTGQVRYLNDFGDARGTWYSYGGLIRGVGKNNLQFAVVQFENGVVFYAMEADNGQIYFQPDFGNNPAVWQRYGKLIRAEGRNNLLLNASASGDGTKFTALDGDTGQIYYMYDLGDDAGVWKAYAQEIK